MSKKTSEEAAREYVWKELEGTERMGGKIPKTDFLAGRKYFIEHELRVYLEMAKMGFVAHTHQSLIDDGVFDYSIDDIIKKAKED